MNKVIPFGNGCGNYVAVLTHKDEEEVLWVDWKLVVIYGEDANERPLYRLDDVGSGFTDDIEKAEVAASGFCKWDGCAELRIDEHICSPDDLGDLLDAIKGVYVACAEIIGRDIQDMCEEKSWTPRSK